PAEHEEAVRIAREVSESTGSPVGIMLDTRGPEVRIEGLEHPTRLEAGQEIILGPGGLQVSHNGLADDVPGGARILLADGALELVALGNEQGGLRCRVVQGGELQPGKKVSVPSVAIRLPVLGAEDVRSLEMARDLELEYVALSFARSAEDIRAAGKILGPDGPWLLAKVELAEAVHNLAEIVKASDGAMVARGDLAVELDPYQVPLIQKRLVHLCNVQAKPVVVATQMLESMIESPTPTRAEVADIAAAVWHGADAVMLSAETAVGRNPVTAVEVMARAASVAESDRDALPQPGLQKELVGEVPVAMAEAAFRVAEHVRAKAIICCTYSGWTARLVAAFRPRPPVVAATSQAQVARKLEGVWGVYPILIREASVTDDLLEDSLTAARAGGLVEPGDQVVFTAGIPFLQAGTTNLVRVVEVN
ncbi:MAG: pyruvate kinase, partial [Candidatus Bipolaricaulota bacterium]